MMSKTTGSTATSRKRSREMQWDDVVEGLEGLTIDKETLVKELTTLCPSAGWFRDQCTRGIQDMICEKCGIEGWTETVLDAIGSVIETEVEKVKRCLYSPSTPLDSPSFLKVVNMLFKKNIAVPNDFKELLFTAPYTSASQATSSSPATTSATTVLKTVQLVLKKTMKELHSKEACGIPLLGVFVAHLALTLTDTTKLSFLADMEFSVVRHKMQRGTKPASDAALVVALVHQVKPVLLFEYKPVVDTRKAMVKRNDLLEVVLQGFYGLYQHNVPTLLHCLTDLSQWYYFKLDKEEPSKMKIARFHSIQEEELNLQTHCSFLGPVFTNDILPRQGLT